MLLSGDALGRPVLGQISSGEAVQVAWLMPLSVPVRRPPRVAPSQQQFIAYGSYRPIVPFAWFAPLSEPVRTRPRLRPGLQPAFTMNPQPFVPRDWYMPLSEPVRTKPGLKASRQQFLAAPSRLLPTPTLFATLSALETKDTFLGGAQTWNRITNTEIGVINTTSQPAEIGVAPAAPAAGTVTVRISIIIR